MTDPADTTAEPRTHYDDYRNDVLDHMVHEKDCDWSTVGECSCDVGEMLTALLRSRRDTEAAQPRPAEPGLVEALAAYRANPIDARDRPESWRALSDLLDACDAALAASPAEPAEGLDARIREHLWRGHGHDFIYGDDGEMQCNWAHDHADFKRDTLVHLLRHCDLASLTLASQPVQPEGGTLR